MGLFSFLDSDEKKGWYADKAAEAAAKAAAKYGLDVEVIAPRKWVYRTSEGKDIKDRQSFIERFVPSAPIVEAPQEAVEPQESIYSLVDDPKVQEGISFDDDGALVTKVSSLTGNKHQMYIPGATSKAFEEWQSGKKHIQDAFPDLSPEQREFMLSGATPAEWEMLRPPDEDDYTTDTEISEEELIEKTTPTTKKDINEEVKKLRQEQSKTEDAIAKELKLAQDKDRDAKRTVREAFLDTALRVIAQKPGKDKPIPFKSWIQDHTLESVFVLAIIAYICSTKKCRIG